MSCILLTSNTNFGTATLHSLRYRENISIDSDITAHLPTTDTSLDHKNTGIPILVEEAAVQATIQYQA
jgi:hypothetical protein